MWIRAGQYTRQDNWILTEVIRNNVYQLPWPEHVRTCIDIGAHIGAFPKALRQTYGNHLHCVCVEPCPENYEVLARNIDRRDRAYQAACSYLEGTVVLHNTVFDGGNTTAGSRIFEGTVPAELFSDNTGWTDTRPIETITLEQLLTDAQWERCDLLKLDCEYAEHDILRNATCLDRFGAICGEFHEKAAWLETADLLRSRGWQVQEIVDHGETGQFRCWK